MGECNSVNVFALAAIVSLLASQFSGAQKTLSLTSEPSSSSEPFCQGPVTFTCRGTELPFVLDWRLNDSVLSRYSFSSSDFFPFDVDPITSGLFPSGVSIEVTNATRNPSVDNSIDVNLTLTAVDVSVLNGSSLHCQDSLGFRSDPAINVEVNSRDPAPSPMFECFLRLTSGDPELVLQWEESFNSLHVVQSYNVTVTPDPSICSGNQVPPSEDYSCSRLDLMGTNYSIAVSAINCVDQEGERATFDIRPQLLVPQSASNVIIKRTDQNELSINWTESITHSGRCSLVGAVNYTVALVDNTGRIVEERNVGSASANCINGNCSIIISSQLCEFDVRIVATNEFGFSEVTTPSKVPPKLTSANIVLLGLGVVLWFVAIAGVGAVFIVMKVKKIRVSTVSKWFLILLLCGVLLIAVSAVLWVAMGFQVGLQDSTCDEAWQTARDGLIISFLAFSVASLLTVAVFIAVFVYSMNERKKSGVQEIALKPRHNEVTGDDGMFRNKQESTLDTKERYEQEEKLRRQAKEFVIVDVRTDPAVYDVTQHHIPTMNVPPQDSTYSALEPEDNEKEGYSVLHAVKSKLRRAVLSKPSEYGELGGDEGKEPPKSAVKQSGDQGRHTEVEGPDKSVVKQSVYPCSAMGRHNRYCRMLKPLPPPKQLSEWFPRERAWHMKDLSYGLLVVYVDPKEMEKLIMPIINYTWRNLFILGPQECANIRIQVRDTSDNWSALGSVAKIIPKDKPTMVLNFSNMSDEEVKATVVHQFGHALGLGHALMKPDDWEVLKPYLDTRAMMEFYDSQSMEEFEVQWTGKGLDDGVVNYDEESMMRYSTSLSWLKEETYRDADGVNSVEDADTKRKLQGFLKHTDSVPSALSTKDYYEILNTVRQAMSVDNLLHLGDRSTVTLTKILAVDWCTIGDTLGVKKSVLNNIESSYKDAERLEHVWQEWCDHTDKISHKKKYPFKWIGLHTLLIDIGKKEIADKFLPFLNFD